MKRPSRIPARALALVLAATALAAPLAASEMGAADEKSAAIAAAVMERMGGQEAWQATRYVTWNFFASRRHLWDKHTGDLRIEGVDRGTQQPYLILMNLHTGEGRAWSGGEEVTEPGALAEMLDNGEAAWINDSYWLFMPYKLRDPGVTLTYVGAGTMLDGRSAETLELTFEGVGRTPENKYRVYVADDSGLVEQWDFYRQAGDAEPGFQVPWHGWQAHGEILLSADRGERGHTDVAVLERVPDGVFTSPQPVDWAALVASAGGEGE